MLFTHIDHLFGHIAFNIPREAINMQEKTMIKKTSHPTTILLSKWEFSSQFDEIRAQIPFSCQLMVFRFICELSQLSGFFDPWQPWELEKLYGKQHHNKAEF